MSTKTKQNLIEDFSEQINDFINSSPTELLFEEVGELYILFQKIKNNKKKNLKKKIKKIEKKDIKVFTHFTDYATLEEVYGVETFTKHIQEPNAIDRTREVINSLRNANLQLRSEPLIPKKTVSIFNNSTIEPMELPNLDNIEELPDNIDLKNIIENLENQSDDESSFENVQDEVLDWNLEN
jgi:thymidylate synthase